MLPFPFQKRRLRNSIFAFSSFILYTFVCLDKRNGPRRQIRDRFASTLVIAAAIIATRHLPSLRVTFAIS